MPMDIEQEIATLKSSHKVTRIVFAVCLALAAIVIILLLSDRRPATDATTIKQIVRDSMVAYDKRTKPIIDTLIEAKKNADLRLGSLEEGLSNTDANVAEVKNKYDKIRNNIIHGTTDGKLRFLTEHLPKSTTSGK